MEYAADVEKEQHRNKEGNLHRANNFDSGIHADLPQAALTCKFSTARKLSQHTEPRRQG